MVAKEFIVAIELGSSKITGIAGSKNFDGSITVHHIVKEDSSAFIHKGVVYNIEKTAQCITSIVGKLSVKMKARIQKVYVGIGGQSIRSILNVVPNELPAVTQITQDMIDELNDANYSMKYPDQEILDVAIQEYLVDNQLQIDPVGVQCSHLEGNYLTILQRKAFYDKLNSCLEVANISVAEMFLAPLALADSVLTETERRSGCALVDIGADTTTVSVYSKNILRHLAVIPLGSNNITKDIASLNNIEESEAERMKLKYASAYTDPNDIDEAKSFPIDAERSIESKKFIDIVEGRLQEITENVKYQIPPKYADKLLGGIILTGGGANIPNIEKAFKVNHHMEKTRIARTVTHTINSTLPELKQQDGTLCTILALLAKGDINCSGGELPTRNDLFDNGNITDTPPANDSPIQVRKPGDLKPGAVLTAAEKKLAEEEAERQRQIKEAEERRKKAEEEEEERRRRRENSVAHKMWKKIKDWGKVMTSPDEE